MQLLTLQNFNKFKFIGFNLSFNKNNNFEFFYIGFKEYYKFNNLKLSLKTDLKKNLIIIRRDLSKKKLTPFFYTNYCYPNISIKSRYTLFYKKRNENLLLSRIEKFIKRLNRYKCFNYLYEILKRKKLKYLFTGIMTQIGNYDSGYKLSCYGIRHYFLYFKRQYKNKMTFISKKNYYQFNFSLYRSQINYFIHNFYKILKSFIESYIYRKIEVKINDNSYHLNYFYKEILKLKKFFRFYFIFIYKIVPPPRGKRIRLKKILRFYYSIYKSIFKIFFKRFFNFLLKKKVNIFYLINNMNLKNINYFISNFIYIKNKSLNKEKNKVYIAYYYKLEQVYLERLKSKKNVYEIYNKKKYYIELDKIKGYILRDRLKKNYLLRDILRLLSNTGSDLDILKYKKYYNTLKRRKHIYRYYILRKLYESDKRRNKSKRVQFF